MNESRSAPWRDELRRGMKNKERLALVRVKMPELEAAARSRSYEEVNRGLSLQQAVREAARCFDCPSPACIAGCPVEIDIPAFIKNIERGEIGEAAKVLKETSALPSVCGRVCPQEKQCESRCIRLKMKSEAVAIGHLERFAADYEYETGAAALPSIAERNGVRVAVVGSGPAGLSFAGEMAKNGCDVTVYEALHEVGGVLRYGIPAFRLPAAVVDREIEMLRKMGVKFITNCVVGKTLSQDDLLRAGFQGIFIAVGAGLPNFMHIAGENLSGVLSSNEYLTRVNLMGAYRAETDTPVFAGQRVAVIGGGNTAMDSVRTARRLGAAEAVIIYRRSEDEMPARREEMDHAKAEGVIFKNLYNPIGYLGDEQGHVRQILLQPMVLGEPDASGRRRPVAVEGLTEKMDVDLVIVAIGVSPNPLVPQAFHGLEISGGGTITVDPDTLQTALPEVYAGGDIVRGGATVILAMGDGRKAAKGMFGSLRQRLSLDV